jgi:hypothetical protein
MHLEREALAELLERIVDHLDIPKSYYEKASERHRTLGDWLCRPDSRVARFRPAVRPQGSFRYGTVTRPLMPSDSYDLDNIATLMIGRDAMTQRQVKTLYGAEVKDYAREHRMVNPVEEKDRCWRLEYADEASFHLDTLPSLPEDDAVINAIVARGVPPELANQAVAITDKRHPRYDQITTMLLSSNPSGFAAWFEARVRPYAEARRRRLVESRIYASVEDVPPYEWKTPLQRAIQLFKRHRDVMFQERPELAPISMIITNLAVNAYEGEPNLWDSLDGLVRKMPAYVRPARPRVPNPADPAEDYADKWSRDARLEKAFWEWHEQLTADVAKLAQLLSRPTIHTEIRSVFQVSLTGDEAARFTKRTAVGAAISGAPAVVLPSGPQPWAGSE